MCISPISSSCSKRLIPCHVQVANGDCSSICRIIWPRNGLEMQQEPHHLPNLPLLRCAVSGHRELHFARLVFADSDASIDQRQHRHTTCMAYSDGGGDIAPKEEFFHRRFLWSIFVHQGTELLVNLL